MTALLPDVDPDGLLEYSVVFTDRSLNHMSAAFQQVMRDLSGGLREVYGADGVAIVPGGGTYAMEAVARQFAGGERVLVVRNGWFSYRWSQIFEAGGIPEAETVMKARRTGNDPRAPFAPAPVEEVVARIREERPAAVFAPHVETASGIILPDGYDPRGGGGGARGGRALRARLRGVGLRLGRHAGSWRRRADLGAAEGVERLALGGAGDAVGPRGRAGEGAEVVELCHGPRQVAGDHGGLRGGRARLPRDAADRRAARLARHHGRDARDRARAAARGAVGAGAAGAGAAGGAGGAIGRGRGVRGAGGGGQLSPGTRRSSRASPLPRPGCRSRRACR